MDSELNNFRRLAKAKSPVREEIPALGPELISFFKQKIQKRQAKFSPIAACWSQLVPEMLLKRTALESFSKGTLTVLVDSSAHLYDLKLLLLSSLQKQMVLACRSSGLRNIVLKQGRWYEGESQEKGRLKF